MRNLMRWAVTVCALALAATATTACSDDDSGSGPQSEVADMTIEQFSADGAEVDEDCIRDLADQLSDDDAQALVDSDLSGESGVSAEGQALGAQLLDCISIEGIDLDDVTDGSSVDTTEGG